MNGPVLSTELDDPSAVPYFLWDEPMTSSEFRERIRAASESERVRLLSKLLREARDTEVWKFTDLAEVLRFWPRIRMQLGRRRTFWEFLLESWRREGLLGG